MNFVVLKNRKQLKINTYEQCFKSVSLSYNLIVQTVSIYQFSSFATSVLPTTVDDGDVTTWQTHTEGALVFCMFSVVSILNPTTMYNILHIQYKCIIFRYIGSKYVVILKFYFAQIYTCNNQWVPFCDKRAFCRLCPS